jgi:hypothetical protein
MRRASPTSGDIEPLQVSYLQSGARVRFGLRVPQVDPQPIAYVFTPRSTAP